MLCTMYCSLIAAYAETMWSVLNSHKGAFCVLASFWVRSSKEAWQENASPFLELRNSQGLSWSMSQSIFISSKKQHAHNAHEYTYFLDQHAHGRKCICYLEKGGAGRENENCVWSKLKLEKTRAALRWVYDRALKINVLKQLFLILFLAFTCSTSLPLIQIQQWTVPIIHLFSYSYDKC